MLAALTTSCATGGRETKKAEVEYRTITETKTEVIDTACNWVKPIMLLRSEVDSLSEETKRQILAHNEALLKVCGDGIIPKD